VTVNDFEVRKIGKRYLADVPLLELVRAQSVLSTLTRDMNHSNPKDSNRRLDRKKVKLSIQVLLQCLTA
jgi:hypothetical protein